MEWQSEQERKESKSIYHSEKEDSYIPIAPKSIDANKYVDDKEKEATVVKSSKKVPKVTNDKR